MGSPTLDRRMGMVGDKGMKGPVLLAITTPITLSGEQTIDGVLTSNCRVAVMGQADPIQNGLYDSSSGAWTRCFDANGVYDLMQGTTFRVAQGTTYANLYYAVTSPDPITPGVTPLTFALALNQTSQSSTITGGTIDGTPIGDTVPSTGVFTTLTAQTINATTDIQINGVSISALGIQTAYIPAGTMTPNNTNGAAWGLTETGTNKVMLRSLDFADGGTPLYAQFTIAMPPEWNALTISSTFKWTANSTSTNSVVWGIRGTAFGDNDALDASWGTAQTVTQANKSTAYKCNATSATPDITISNAGASKFVVIQIYRDPTNGSDTLAATASLLGMSIRFSITGVAGLSLPVVVAQGGTGSTTAAAALAALGAAASGANADITSITGLTTPLPVSEGGTGSTTAAGARAALGLDSGAAALSVGTAAYNLVQLDASAKLPAVDGSQLTNLAFHTNFTSSEITFTGSDHAKSAAHGLSAIPSLIQAVIRCKTAELGYSIGDEVYISPQVTSGNMCQAWANATNVGVTGGGTNFSGIYLNNKTTTGYGTITPGNWVFVFRAWL